MIYNRKQMMCPIDPPPPDLDPIKPDEEDEDQ